MSNELVFDPDAVETVFDYLSSCGHETGVFSTNPFLLNEAWNLREQFEIAFPEESPSESYLRYMTDHLLNRAPVSAICDLVAAWIDDREGPWAACINLMDAHTAYIPTRSYNRFESSFKLLNPSNIRYDGEFAVPQSRFRTKMNLYDGCIAQCSAEVADLLFRIRDMGELAKTHTVVTSDHGEGFGEPDDVSGSPISFHWNSLNEELLHVPLYERRPGQTAFEINSDLATLRRLPDVFREGTSFNTERSLAHHLYGGNVSDARRLEGEVGKVVYKQQDGGIIKFISDPRGVFSTDSIPERQISEIVDQAFAETSDSESLVLRPSGEVNERLRRLGYR